MHLGSLPLGWQGNFQYVARGLFSFSRFTILTFGGVVALGCCFCPKNCSEGPGQGEAPLASGTSGVGGGAFGLSSSFAFAIAVSMSFSRVANRSCSCSVGVFVGLVFLLLVSLFNVKLSLAICSSRFCKKEARRAMIMCSIVRLKLCQKSSV